ncbi:hypothetical protein [Paenibacillus kribbensis]|uniref:hypothetical protein n=1 Tax=Paenibacillus kribbensis TaxID=172713 RepID=UPI00114CBE54|nr:hypothetical protein [Paenibacillus kribbensis]
MNMRHFHKHQPERCVLCHSTDSIIISKGAYLCAHCYLKSTYKSPTEVESYHRAKVAFLVKLYIEHHK